VTEEEAKFWLAQSPYVSRETYARLDELRRLVLEESKAQNLVSEASVPHFWARHIVDSAQLLRFAENAPTGDWLDLGTGAGFPGMVIGLLSERPIIFVESRRKRFEFLHSLVDHFGLSHVRVHGGRLETLATCQAAVISARAFAPLTRLLPLAQRFAAPDTLWILPKGRGAKAELALIADTWHGRFDFCPSLTDDDAAILVATLVSRASKTGKSVSGRKQVT
jgi:16S rRNA (guanine527-N7)-methyltransferase